MLNCKGIRKVYKNRCVVDKLNFKVNKGDVFALLGSNGAGKTTTIKMILGLISVDEGEILVEDGIKIGYSPETPYFPPFLTGYEVLMYYGKIQKINKNTLREEVDNILQMVGLEKNKTTVKYYSKGMLQRLAFAQAMLGNPELLILDEPTAGLDSLGRVEMINLIRDLKKTGKTIIVNSHILNDIERVCDRGIIVKKGKLLRNWSKDDLSKGQSLEQLFLITVGGVE